MFTPHKLKQGDRCPLEIHAAASLLCWHLPVLHSFLHVQHKGDVSEPDMNQKVKFAGQRLQAFMEEMC